MYCLLKIVSKLKLGMIELQLKLTQDKKSTNKSKPLAD